MATSQTTLAAIVSVLPAPAPAITTSGPGGAAMTAACSSVGAKSPRAEANSAGLNFVVTRSPFRRPRPVRGSSAAPGNARSRR